MGSSMCYSHSRGSIRSTVSSIQYPPRRCTTIPITITSIKNQNSRVKRQKAKVKKSKVKGAGVIRRQTTDNRRDVSRRAPRKVGGGRVGRRKGRAKAKVRSGKRKEEGGRRNRNRRMNRDKEQVSLASTRAPTSTSPRPFRRADEQTSRRPNDQMVKVAWRSSGLH